MSASTSTSTSTSYDLEVDNLFYERSRSAPPENSERWVSREKPHQLTTTPTRSVSFKVRKELVNKEQCVGIGRSRGKSPLPAQSFRADPILEEAEDSHNSRDPYSSQTLHGLPNGYVYDSDGVPTLFSSNQMRPFKASLKPSLEAEFTRLQAHGAELSATLANFRPIRESLRELYFTNFGKNWTVGMWDEFFALEEKYSTLEEELWDVQSKMEGLSAQMYLFMDAKICSAGDAWSCDGNTSVRCVGVVGGDKGEKGEKGKGERNGKGKGSDGEYPRLEWSGVDYNAVPNVKYEDLYPEYFALGFP